MRVEFLDSVLFYEKAKNVLIHVPSSETFISGITWNHVVFEFYRHSNQLCYAHLVFHDLITLR